MQIAGRVVLKKGREQSTLRKHPWIFSGAIHHIDGTPEDGDWVEVYDHKSNSIGYGHYQNGSIAVRLLSFGSSQPDDSLWTKKISEALQLRKTVGIPSSLTNAFRLIHGEGDGIPGLIADFYNGVIVMQAHSSGIHNDRKKIAAACSDVLGEKLSAIYYKSKSTLPDKIREVQPDEYLFGNTPTSHMITEHGNQFYINWVDGQKTGFFLDQRENRKLVSEFSPDKTVLNTFCYTGGFSVYALRAKAKLVHSIDVSEKAIHLARQNISLNGFDTEKHACTTIDTFEFLKGKEDVYDVIVLDPPAFAKHRHSRHQAVKGYQRLNAEALKVIKSGGILFTFSCSQVVDKQLFYDTVTSAAIQAGREVKVLHQLTQPPDHPVSIFHREGEYLKGLVVYVT